MKSEILSADEEVIEIVLDDAKIKELIEKLKKLEEEKAHIHFMLNKKQQMLIHHVDDDLLK